MFCKSFFRLRNIAFLLFVFAFAFKSEADVITITSDDGSTNGVGTINGGPPGPIAESDINGGDIVSVDISLSVPSGNGLQTINGNTINILDSSEISVQGDNANGVSNYGEGTETNLYGTIVTEGERSYGIRNNGNGNDTNIVGSILAGGYQSYGVGNYGNNNETLVSGSILANMGAAFGVANDGDNNTLDITGSLVVEGTEFGPIAIRIEGNNNVITVSGLVSIDGDFATGIVNLGDNNVVDIYGSVKATGEDSSALLNYTGDRNSFTLNKGAIVIGNITSSLATNNSLTFNFGKEDSYAFSLGGNGLGSGAGMWSFNDTNGTKQGFSTFADTSNCTSELINGNPYISECNLVTGVSTGNQETHSKIHYQKVHSIISSLNLGEKSSLSKSIEANENNPGYWIKIFGGSFEKDGKEHGYAIEGSNHGLTIGIPIAISQKRKTDLILSLSEMDFDIGETKKQKNSSQAAFAGLIIRDFLSNPAWTLDAYGLLGGTSYDFSRKLLNNKMTNGFETVFSSYSSSEGLLGSQLKYNNSILNSSHLFWTAGIDISLSHERIGSYSESVYFSWSKRSLTRFSSGVFLGAGYKKGALRTFVEFRERHSSLPEGKNFEFANNGTSYSMTEGLTSDEYRSMSTGLDYQIQEHLVFSLALKAQSSSEGIDSSFAKISLGWVF